MSSARSINGEATGLAPAASLAALEPSDLAVALRPLFEDARWLADRLARRPFSSWDEVIDVAEHEIDGASEEVRAGLLSAHPRLGADGAELLARSRESWVEQGGGRTVALDAATRLAELNDRYQQRFGFPFVEWVRGRPLEELIPIAEHRLERDRTTEIAAGCEALTAIARDRLAKLPLEPLTSDHGKTP